MMEDGQRHISSGDELSQRRDELAEAISCDPGGRRSSSWENPWPVLLALLVQPCSGVGLGWQQCAALALAPAQGLQGRHHMSLRQYRRV